MKKSFFLLTATLVAMLSFSACTDDKDDDEPVAGTSSSSEGIAGNPSSSSNGNAGGGPGVSSSSSSEAEEPGASSSSSSEAEEPGASSSSTGATTGLTVACEIEMTVETVVGDVVINLCQEYSDVTRAEVLMLKAECIEMSEPGFVTTPGDSCPSGAGLECDDIDEDGEEVKTYYYEPGASMLRAAYGGCPDPSEL